jgi:hypothetical protein
MRGAPAKAIQELAGHADLTMTQRYMHLSPATLDAAISLLEQPSGVQSRGDIVETAAPPPKRSIKTGGKLAVRQGFEPWVEVLPLQRFSKPPPSASRPPHRAGKLSIRRGSSSAKSIVPISVPEIVPASFQDGASKGDGLAYGPARRIQRFFPTVIISANRSCALPFPDELASTSSVGPARGTTRGCRGTLRALSRTGTGL